MIKAAENLMKPEVLSLYLCCMVDSSVHPSGMAEQSRIVRLPLNQVGSLNKINKAYSRFEQDTSVAFTGRVGRT